jgi:hypothetical protein
MGACQQRVVWVRVTSEFLILSRQLLSAQAWLAFGNNQVP